MAATVWLDYSFKTTFTLQGTNEDYYFLKNKQGAGHDDIPNLVLKIETYRAIANLEHR